MTRRGKSELRQRIVETAREQPDLTLRELAAAVTGRKSSFFTLHQHIASLVGNGSLITRRENDTDGFVVLRYRAAEAQGGDA